jgi:hypothetical protein
MEVWIQLKKGALGLPFVIRRKNVSLFHDNTEREYFYYVVMLSITSFSFESSNGLVMNP